MWALKCIANSLGKHAKPELRNLFFPKVEHMIFLDDLSSSYGNCQFFEGMRTAETC